MRRITSSSKQLRLTHAWLASACLATLFRWKKQYANGQLDPEPSREAELEARVRELERLLGKVTLENEFLKKAVRNSLKQAEKKQSSLPKTAPSSKALKGGAN